MENRDNREEEREKTALLVRKKILEEDATDQSREIHGFRHEIFLDGRKIPAAVYPALDSNGAVLFAFHGGGFCFGGYTTEDLLYDLLRTRLGVNVISIGYRRNVKFPAALDDCYDGVRYFLSDPEFHFDRDRIGTFGSSAGANLALTTGMRAFKEKTFRVKEMILNYPYLDVATPPIEKGAPEERLAMENYFASSYASEEIRKCPLVSPVYAQKEDLDPSTRVLLILAERDILRKEGEIFGDKLRAFHFPVCQDTARGMGHGYLEYGFRDGDGWIPPHLKAALVDGSLGQACEWTMRRIEAFYSTKEDEKVCRT